MKVYRIVDDCILIFCLEENVMCMINGVEWMSMFVLDVDIFVDVVKKMVLVNKCWV